MLEHVRIVWYIYIHTCVISLTNEDIIDRLTPYVGNLLLHSIYCLISLSLSAYVCVCVCVCMNVVRMQSSCVVGDYARRAKSHSERGYVGALEGNCSEGALPRAVNRDLLGCV